MTVLPILQLPLDTAALWEATGKPGAAVGSTAAAEALMSHVMSRYQHVLQPQTVTAPVPSNVARP